MRALTERQKGLLKYAEREGRWCPCNNMGAGVNKVIEGLVKRGLIEAKLMRMRGFDKFVTHIRLKPPQYQLCSGTVQAYVSGFTGGRSIVHFGRAEYLQSKPVVSESIREQAMPIVNGLNDGTITEDEAMEQLARIGY